MSCKDIASHGKAAFLCLKTHCQTEELIVLIIVGGKITKARTTIYFPRMSGTLQNGYKNFQLFVLQIPLCTYL